VHATTMQKKPPKYSLSWNVKQTNLFICITTLLAHQVLDNVSLLLNQIFCFTALQTYFLLVVYSLYRELKGTAPPNLAWRVRLNNTLYERKYYNHCLPLQLCWVLLMCIFVYTECIYKCTLINPLNPELNPICYLLACLGAHHFLHVSRIRVKLLTFRLLMSYIYGAPILDVSRSHTTTQHSR